LPDSDFGLEDNAASVLDMLPLDQAPQEPMVAVPEGPDAVEIVPAVPEGPAADKVVEGALPEGQVPPNPEATTPKVKAEPEDETSMVKAEPEPESSKVKAEPEAARPKAKKAKKTPCTKCARWHKGGAEACRAPLCATCGVHHFRPVACSEAKARFDKAFGVAGAQRSGPNAPTQALDHEDLAKFGTLFDAVGNDPTAMRAFGQLLTQAATTGKRKAEDQQEAGSKSAKMTKRASKPGNNTQRPSLTSQTMMAKVALFLSGRGANIVDTQGR
jgi:hypothetical protein